MGETIRRMGRHIKKEQSVKRVLRRDKQKAKKKWVGTITDRKGRGNCSETNEKLREWGEIIKRMGRHNKGEQSTKRE